MLAKPTDRCVANESFHPTKKAIEEHVAKLKRDMKMPTVSTGTGSAFSTPKSAVKRTPASKRVSAIKMSASGKKRNFTSMSDEDGDDDGGLNMSTPLPKRQMTSRRSKSVTGKYADPGSSEDEDEDVATKEEESDDGLEAAFASVKAATTGASPGGLNGSGNHEPKSRNDSVVAARRSPSKSKRVSLDEQSDVSEFDPLA
ncbi:unnamed protein product [Cercospora beticola]|nr:unnamed protein product [Cercospora beticola]